MSTNVADLLREISMRYEAEGDTFRALNYSRAAKALSGRPVTSVKDLNGMKGIGPSTRKDVAEILKKGTCERLEKLRKNGPPATVAQFQRIPGIGPKKAQEIWEDHEVATLEDLKKGIEDGTIPRGDLLEGIEFAMRAVERRRLSKVLPEVQPLLDNIRDLPLVLSANFAGSLRRKQDTIRDVDILVEVDEEITEEEHAELQEQVTKILGDAKIEAIGDRKIRAIGDDGLQVDVLFVPTDEYGAALQYFTGSKEHNISLRRMAKEQGLTLNEKGLWDEEGEQIAGVTEESIYKTLGVPMLVPELRQSGQEIGKEQPDLIGYKDLQGTLHNHTSVDSGGSDGRSSLTEMIKDAELRGHKFIAITDHSQELGKLVHGLTPKRWEHQRQKIEMLRNQYKIRILHSLEMDVLLDGTCDFPDEVIKEFDFVLLACHRKPRQDVAPRFITAIEHIRRNLYITKPIILAHPSGRQFSKGPIAETDWDELFRVCAANGVALEINSMPDRLDLDYLLCQKARRVGCRFCINADAHHIRHQNNLELGINVARRSWLTKEDVLNTQLRCV